jgi:nitroreductase
MANEGAAELIRFLRLLRQVRDFEAKPIPQEAIDDIVEVGRWTGTAKNQQLQEVVVVRDRAKLEALSKCGTAAHVAGAQAAIVIVVDAENQPLDMAAYDEGRLVERIMLAAKAHGLGSGIGWFNGDGVAAARKLLGIPEAKRVKTVISVGYTDQAKLKERPARGRRPTAEFARFEKYA